MIWEIGGRGGLGSDGLVVVVGELAVSIVVEVVSVGSGGVCLFWLFCGRCRMRERRFMDVRYMHVVFPWVSHKLAWRVYMPKGLEMRLLVC